MSSSRQTTSPFPCWSTPSSGSAVALVEEIVSAVPTVPSALTVLSSVPVLRQAMTVVPFGRSAIWVPPPLPILSETGPTSLSGEIRRSRISGLPPASFRQETVATPARSTATMRFDRVQFPGVRRRQRQQRAERAVVLDPAAHTRSIRWISKNRPPGDERPSRGRHRYLRFESPAAGEEVDLRAERTRRRHPPGEQPFAFFGHQAPGRQRVARRVGGDAARFRETAAGQHLAFGGESGLRGGALRQAGQEDERWKPKTDEWSLAPAFRFFRLDDLEVGRLGPRDLTGIVGDDEAGAVLARLQLAAGDLAVEGDRVVARRHPLFDFADLPVAVAVFFLAFFGGDAESFCLCVSSSCP